MVKSNDIFILHKTSGNLKDGNFQIEEFKRPQYAQINSQRYGFPVPLLDSLIMKKRRGCTGIIPILGSLSSMDEESLEDMLGADTSTPVKQVTQAKQAEITKKVSLTSTQSG